MFPGGKSHVFMLFVLHLLFYLTFNNICVTYYVNVAANLDNLGRARQGFPIRTWLAVEKVCLVTT